MSAAERDADRIEQAEVHANAVQEENDRLHKLVDDLRQGDGHEVCRADRERIDTILFHTIGRSFADDLAEGVKRMAVLLETARGEVQRWKAGDDTWRSLAFAYVHAEPGSDAVTDAWYALKGAVEHYEAVERRHELERAEDKRRGEDFRAMVKQRVDGPVAQLSPADEALVANAWAQLDPAHEAAMAVKLDADLAHIKRRAAADQRVIDAAEAMRDALSDVDPGGLLAIDRDLCAAVDARRALADPEIANTQPVPTLAENPVMVQESDGSVYLRPGLGETLKHVDTEFFVFVGDDPDTAKVGVDADGIDDAAGFLAAMPGAAIAIRNVYAGEWAVNRPTVEPTSTPPPPAVRADS